MSTEEQEMEKLAILDALDDASRLLAARYLDALQQGRVTQARVYKLLAGNVVDLKQRAPYTKEWQRDA